MIGRFNKRMMRAAWSSCLVCALTPPTAAQVDPERAAAYFEEAATLCQREGSRLWGVSLCGPMVFADPVTGTIATNQDAPDAPRPRVLGYANAALEWGGERWATFVWPMIPEDETARARLLLHELFHRVQPELGLYIPLSDGENEHLDTPEGRYWMQLEWRALAEALESSGEEEIQALRDALAFRAIRHARFPGAAERERASEINEGLAQYTATVAAAPSLRRAAADAVDQLAEAAEKESLVRTFAYPSGTAYGILLDARSPGWTRRLEATADLGQMLGAASGIGPAESAESDESAESAARRYGGPELWAAEQELESERQARIAELRDRFVDGPVLVLPRGRNASFITTGVHPIPGSGTIYPSFRVTGEWGSIEAEQVLTSVDGRTLTVPAPFTVEGEQLSGDGWTVELATGWAVRPGPRPGDFEVVPDQR
ncbi:MAG TPA: hypothetical protein VMV46_04235 [Thermoanaerobaculia bacterium]|nr:hypothetical protein [Thermoanaerobaculia bacterium]